MRKAKLKVKLPEWAYIVARIRVMSRKLIPKTEYLKLLNMDLNEIIKYLEETEYKREIDELAYKYKGLELIEYSLTLNLSRTYRRILRLTRGAAREIILKYLKKWDFWNIKNIIRGKKFGFSKEEIEGTLVIAGEYDEDFYKSLLVREGLEDIIKEFEKEPYYHILEKLITERPLSKYEDELDKYYYSTLIEIEPKTKDLKIFINFIKMEIDIKNIKTILRLRAEGSKPEEIFEKIIPGGYQLSEAEARKLATAEQKELFEQLKKYWFCEEVEEKVETLPLSRLEVCLDRTWAKKVIVHSRYNPVSVLPVLGYILLKKIEVDNLRILARGKEEGIPAETLKEQLVLI